MRDLRKFLEESEKVTKQPSLEDLAAQQGISTEELKAMMDKEKKRMKRFTPKKKARTPKREIKNVIGHTIDDSGIDDQVINYDVSNNKHSGLFAGNAGDNKGVKTAFEAMNDMKEWITQLSNVSDSKEPETDRVAYKQLRKDIFNELSNAGVPGVSNDILALADSTEDLDDKNEKKLLKAIASPYGYDEVEDEWDDKKTGEVRKTKAKDAIRGPYRSLISSLGLTPYFGAVTKDDTGGSRYMKTNPYKALFMDWSMDKDKANIGRSDKLNNLLDGAAGGNLSEDDLNTVEELYETFLIDKRIADEISDVTGVNYEDFYTNPVGRVKEESEAPDADVAEMDDAMTNLSEESRRLTRRRTMKLSRQEKQRQKLVIEESRRHFDKKKKALINFVEESVDGLTVSEERKAKSRIKGRSGKWIKGNIKSVIRKAIEESLASRRELIRDSRTNSNDRLVQESRGDDRRRTRKGKNGKSLVEESIKAKSRRKPLVEESRIEDTNDDYSKASQFL